ncbi:DUF2415 domain-containing protein [Mycena kentingensis (nom. inval.)]|nr:DUF2415 domain-containing protein [Mycena kentingensis (nom. inval.)]
MSPSNHALFLENAFIAFMALVASVVAILCTLGVSVNGALFIPLMIEWLRVFVAGWYLVMREVRARKRNEPSYGLTVAVSVAEFALGCAILLFFVLRGELCTEFGAFGNSCVAAMAVVWLTGMATVSAVVPIVLVVAFHHIQSIEQRRAGNGEGPETFSAVTAGAMEAEKQGWTSPLTRIGATYFQPLTKASLRETVSTSRGNSNWHCYRAVACGVTIGSRAAANVTISHVQLRDVLVCPRERGVVSYVQGSCIKEQNILDPSTPPCTLAELGFMPNTLTSLPVPETDHTLLAAGGQDAEIHLSLLRPDNIVDWQFSTHLDGSINNSILLTSLSLTDSPESSVEPRMAVSNNDRVVMFFDVPIRAEPARIAQVGSVRMNVPINHSSISPDGRTLLSVGDSNKVFLHRLTGGGYVTATPIETLTLPSTPNPFSSPALVASFSTAFSSDGSKYAVASQEGSVAVWDVRSTRPLKVFYTDKTRDCSSISANGERTSWDPQDWNHWKRGPGWSTRVVKFGGGRGGSGKELMMFTEHTSLVHIVDARTFETEEIVRVPSFPALPCHSSGSRTHASAASTARIVRTLEETFRVNASANGEEDDVLVIPPLGDRSVEREVRRVLQEHGLRTRHAPPPEPENEDVSEPAVAEETESNLAGACFDPSGAWVYVASERGIAEWGIRGADKRWWGGDVCGGWER